VDGITKKDIKEQGISQIKVAVQQHTIITDEDLDDLRLTRS
jgi:hypothetical protein